MQLSKVFRSQGLEKYGEVADKFDPHLHDAMFEIADPAQEPGTLGQVCIFVCLCRHENRCLYLSTRHREPSDSLVRVLK